RAGGDLDDAGATGLGVAADGRVEGLGGGHVDGRVGEAALLGPVEHLVVHVGAGDRHGDAPGSGAGVSWRSQYLPNLRCQEPRIVDRSTTRSALVAGHQLAQALALLAAGPKARGGGAPP